MSKKNLPVKCVAIRPVTDVCAEIHELTIRQSTPFGEMLITIQTGAVEYDEILEKQPDCIVDHRVIESTPISIGNSQ